MRRTDPKLHWEPMKRFLGIRLAGVVLAPVAISAQVVLEGRIIDDVTSLAPHTDLLAPVEGIALSPLEARRPAQCGVIAIWTKSGP